MRNKQQRLTAWIIMAWLALGAASQGQVIKMGTIVPKGSPWYKSLEELAQDWSKISGGKIRVRIYPDGVAGDEPVMIQQMRVGRLHAAALSSMSLVSIDPNIEALTFPTLLQTDEELDHIITTVGPIFEASLEKKGFKVLNWTTTGWVRIFTKQPATNLEGMRSQKMIFWGQDAVYTEFLKSIGIQTVPLTVTDMLPALQTGTADAFAAPPAAALAFQWYSQANNMTDFRWQPIPGMIVMSKKGWRSIKDEWKPELLKSSQKIAKKLMAASRALDDDAIQAMKKNGLTVHAMSPEDADALRKLLREKGEPVFVGNRISREMFDKVNSEIEKFRATK